jgi:hypothetical protein
MRRPRPESADSDTNDHLVDADALMRQEPDEDKDEEEDDGDSKEDDDADEENDDGYTPPLLVVSERS